MWLESNGNKWHHPYSIHTSVPYRHLDNRRDQWFHQKVHILTLLGRGASTIFQLKGIDKDGKDPLPNEPLTRSIGDGGAPTSISEGVS